MNTYGVVDRLNHCRETRWSVVKVKPLERGRERERGREDTIIVLDYEPVCAILMERVLCWDEN